MDIKIDPEFRDFLPALSKDEKDGLEKNLVHNGCIHPLVVWKETGILIDGHNRYEICNKRGIRFPITEIPFKDKFEALFFISNLQHDRRNMNKWNIFMMLTKLETVLSKQTSDRVSEIAKLIHKGAKKKEKEFENVGQHTRDELVKQSGLGAGTLARAKVVLQKASPKVKKDLAKGKTTIGTEYRKVVKPPKSSPGPKTDSKEPPMTKKEVAAVVEDSKFKGLEIEPAIWQMGYDHFFDTVLVKKEIDLLVTDPPSSHDYRKINKETYLDFVELWLDYALKRVKDSGHIYILIRWEDIMVYLSALSDHASRFELADILGWLVPNAPGKRMEKEFKKDLFPILHVVGHDAPSLNFGDGEDSSGVIPEFSPGGNSEPKVSPYQKPSNLIEKFVRTSSKAGDLVVDCFAGTGTTLLVGAMLGRKVMGCEVDNTMISKAKKRRCVLKS